MSKTIDQRVVEMRFDNRHFENNVRETMTTLEKLKQKLNLSGASKGLENLNSSANKVNMNGLSNALDSVHSRFSALEVMGVTALANITNSAVNAGKRMISALTIDPIKTGLSEYETQIGAIQTILSNTRSEGTNVEIVNKALDELNAYADKTIYNFTEMTKNIGTFTAAGVKLDTSVNAIKGIANLAAMSGSTSQQASTAMYQLSQALAAGKVSLMDWNSVVNAGMGGKLFQDALVRTSELLGTGAKEAIKTYGTFRESLTKGEWLTTEVLTETLNQLSGAYSEADLISQGFTKKQAAEILALAKDAEDAATEVKTFTQLWDVLKESAQSGWAQTWRLIIGDFEQAKALLSPLAKFLTGVIEKFSNARNKLLEGALSHNPFTALLEKLENSGIGKVAKKVSGISKSLEEYQKIVNKVWRGDYNNRGDNPDRFDLLEKEGLNPHVVQNLVNKGYKYKLTVEDIEKAEKKHGVTVKESTKAVEELTDAQLKKAGLTDEEIRLYRQLEEQSKKTGKSIDEIVESMNQKDGRTLLIESFKNAGLGLIKVFKSIGEAWTNAFPPMTSLQLYNIIAGLNEFSKKLVMSDDTAKDLTRTLKGVFAIIDLVAMVAGGAFKIAFTVLKTVLGMFNIDILEFTAIIGDAIVKFRDWVEQFNPVVIIVQKLTPLLVKMGKAVGKFAKELWNLPQVQNAISKIANAFSKLDDVTLDDVISALRKFGNHIKTVLSNINEHFGGMPGDILAGLGNGLKNGISTVITYIAELANKIINKFKEILGIHSPSTVFFAIGGFIIAGLIGGLLAGIPGINDGVGTIVDKITGFFSNIDWSKLFAGGMSIGILMTVKKLSDTLSNLTAPLGGLGDLLSGAGEVLEESSKGIGKILKQTAKVVKSFSKILSGIAFKKQTEGIKNLATSILILAGAVFIIAKLDIKEMWNAVGVIAALSVILGVLTWALQKINTSAVEISKEKGIKFNQVKVSLVSIGAAILLMGAVIKMMSNMSPEQMKQGFIGLAGAVAALGILIAVYGTLVKGKGAQNMDKAGKMLKKMAWTLLLLTVAVKLISFLDYSEIRKGTLFIAGFIVFVGLLSLVTSKAGKNIDRVGKAVSKISWALLLMVAVVKLASMLSLGELAKGALFLAGFVIFVGALVSITKIGKDTQIAKVGGMLLGVSAALLIMVGVVKLASMLDPADLIKGGLAITLFGGIIAGLLYMVKLIGPQAPKLAATIVSMGIAIGILAAVAIVMSLISIEGLAKGVIAVGLLSLMMMGLIAVTKNVSAVTSTLITLTVAIGVLALALGVLSFIDPTKLAGATTAISIVLGMFALVMLASGAITTSMGTLIVLTIAIGLLSTALYLLARLPIEQSLGAAASLSLLLLSLSAALVILGVVGTMGPAAFIGIGALAALIVGLTAVVIAIGALMDKFPALENFLGKGLSALKQLAQGIGEAIGAFVKGVITEIASGLPAIGTSLSMFMTNLLPFITGAKMIDGSVLAGVGILAASIIALCAANFIEGVTSFLPFVGSFAELGTSLSQFMINALPFIQMSSMINPSIMEGIKALAEAILILTGANIVDGISRLFGSESSLEKFGSQLGGLATNLNQFATNLGTFDESKVATVNCACNAIKALAQAASTIPNEGGLWASIVGENSLSTFASKLPGLATHLNGFITNLGTFDDSKVTTVNCACKAVKALAEAASAIPNEGGLWASIVGENSLATFASKLPGLAKHLNGFITNLGIFDESKITTVNCACKAIKSLASAAKTIPNEGGLWASIVGDNSLATFGSKLPGLAKHIASFVKNLGTFNEGQVATVNSACNAIKSIAKLGNIDIKDTGNGLNSFGKNMVKFAKKVKDFVSEIGEVGAGGIDSAIKKTNELVSMAKNVANTNIDSLSTFGNSLKKVAKDGVKGFVKEFSGASPKSEAKKATKEMLGAAIDGAESKKSDVKKKFKSIAEAAVDAMCTQSLKSDASQAGKDLVTGFANGIKNNKSLASNAGSSLGKAALKAAKEAIDSNSPSKEAMKIGNYFGQGMVIGIEDYQAKTYNTAYNVGEYAKKGLSNAISKISNIINSDIDTQPTIRPVLDLSDVESGAGYLNTMFNNSPSIGVMSNLRAISSGMNTRNQNGTNGDVVTAINKLRKDLGNVSGTTNNYNVNGVTYDDGSNVTDAVKTLIRAVKVEGRI